jgi:hypothetical protein
MRIYFNLVRRQDVLEDDEGIDVADLRSAQAEAIEALIAMRRSAHSGRPEWDGWTLQIVDRSGDILATVNLDSVDRD